MHGAPEGHHDPGCRTLIFCLCTWQEESCNLEVDKSIYEGQGWLPVEGKSRVALYRRPTAGHNTSWTQNDACLGPDQITKVDIQGASCSEVISAVNQIKPLVCSSGARYILHKMYEVNSILSTVKTRLVSTIYYIVWHCMALVTLNDSTVCPKH